MQQQYNHFKKNAKLNSLSIIVCKYLFSSKSNFFLLISKNQKQNTNCTMVNVLRNFFRSTPAAVTTNKHKKMCKTMTTRKTLIFKKNIIVKNVTGDSDTNGNIYWVCQKSSWTILSKVLEKHISLKGI